MKIKLNLRTIKIIKAFTYRIWSSTCGFMIVYGLSGSASVAGWFTGMELVWKPMLYYFHDIIWMPYEKKYMDAGSKDATGTGV